MYRTMKMMVNKNQNLSILFVVFDGLTRAQLDHESSRGWTAGFLLFEAIGYVFAFRRIDYKYIGVS